MVCAVWWFLRSGFPLDQYNPEGYLCTNAVRVIENYYSIDYYMSIPISLMDSLLKREKYNYRDGLICFQVVPTKLYESVSF